MYWGMGVSPLSYASVFETFLSLLLAAFVEFPLGVQVTGIRKTQHGVVHMAGLWAGQIGGVQKLEAKLARFGIVAAGLHTGLVAGHAVMRQEQPVAIQMVCGEHVVHVRDGLAFEH